jgi:hypothetical protein
VHEVEVVGLEQRAADARARTQVETVSADGAELLQEGKQEGVQHSGKQLSSSPIRSNQVESAHLHHKEAERVPPALRALPEEVRTSRESEHMMGPRE